MFVKFEFFDANSFFALGIMPYISSQDISKKSFTTRVINENFNEKTDVFEIMTDMDNYFIIDNGDYLLSRNNEKTRHNFYYSNIF